MEIKTVDTLASPAWSYFAHFAIPANAVPCTGYVRFAAEMFQLFCRRLRAYLKFILREASAVFVAWAVILTLLQIRALTRGPADYAENLRSEIEKWGKVVRSANIKVD